jgi:Protein of unknown function (DUF3106)
MKRPGRLILAVTVLGLLNFARLASPALLAQDANSRAKQHPDTNQIAPPLPPPLSPVPERKPPVTLFRELLAMDPAERQKALADRTPENRKLILAKVREYESLKPDVRELRLRATELRWYLLPLMRMAPADRANRIEQIPANDRSMVVARLREWDKLPADVQKQLVDNEATLRYFTEVQDTRVRSLSEEQKRKLQAGIAQWQAMPEDQRDKLMNRFNRFFVLTSDEKESALKTLSEPERLQIEKTLRSFAQLPASQRAQCIRSFEKFASLSVLERQQFLKNAERWKVMKPAERQAWRELVNSMPLVPVNFNTAPLQQKAPLPPMPETTGGPPRHHSAALAGTNAGGAGLPSTGQ